MAIVSRQMRPAVTLNGVMNWPKNLVGNLDNTSGHRDDKCCNGSEKGPRCSQLFKSPYTPHKPHEELSCKWPSQRGPSMAKLYAECIPITGFGDNATPVECFEYADVAESELNPTPTGHSRSDREPPSWPISRDSQAAQ